MQRPRIYSFRGRIPASKSILNRLLLIGSHAGEGAFRVVGDSACQDVIHMRAALAALQKKSGTIPCGEAGLVLRLMAARASRVPGKWDLQGSPRLMERPSAPLREALAALGVRMDFSSETLSLQGQGWTAPASPIPLDRSLSSQFASALLLNAWDLTFPLEIEWRGAPVSEGYFDMSVALAREAGMEIVETSSGFLVPPGQRVKPSLIEAESDLSSAFAIAALGAVGGYAEIQGFPSESLQPDRAFPGLLTRMGVEIDLRDRVLIVHKAEKLRPIETDLGGTPDLFPVLAALSALAEGRSVLRGAPQLVHKESDRIRSLSRLISLMGRRSEALDDGIVIHGKAGENLPAYPSAIFNPERDHRLVFAASVAIQAGIPIRLTDVAPVDKSFPEFRVELNRIVPA